MGRNHLLHIYSIGCFGMKKGLAVNPSLTANPLNLLWRKCMGIEPTYRLTQTVHRI